MKKLLVLAFVLGLALGAGTITPALAGLLSCGTPGGLAVPDLCRASISLRVGNPIAPITINQAVPVRVDAQGDGIVTNFTVNIPASIGGGFVRINNLRMDRDPGIFFSVAETNLTPFPSFVTMIFTEAIALTGLVQADSSIGWSLTDGFFADQTGAPGATITPFAQPLVLKADDNAPGFPFGNKGVDVGPAADGGGPAPDGCSAFANGTSTCGPYAAGPSFFSGGPFVLMTASVSFELSPRDSVGLSGLVTQNQVQTQVPEPASLFLVGFGLVGVGVLWRRRQHP